MAGPGQPKTGGRKPGTPNRITRAVKTAVLEAFDELGGPAYLVKVGEDEPRVFCALLAKVLPSEIKADVGTDHEQLLEAMERGRKRADAARDRSLVLAELIEERSERTGVDGNVLVERLLELAQAETA